MDSKIVNKEIRLSIKPVLKTYGFEKFTSRSAWKFNEHTIEVINFQSFNSYLAQSLGVTTFSFSVNIGVFYKQNPKLPWALQPQKDLPEEYECNARRVLTKKIKQKFSRTDIWSISSNGHNLNECIADAKDVILTDGIAWLKEFTDLGKAFNIFKSKSETFIKNSIAIELLGGRNYSLARSDTIITIGLLLGKHEEVYNYLSKVLENPFYKASKEEIKYRIKWVKNLC